MERFFQICDHCGAWREITKGVRPEQPFSLLWPLDYDSRYFLQEHTFCRCPAQHPDARSGLRNIQSSDVGFQFPDPAKQWHPEKCPDYRPPQTPVVSAKTALSEADLLGCWMPNNFGGNEHEAWVFEAEGRGKVISIRFYKPAEHALNWQVEQERELLLHLIEPVTFPPLLFLRAGRWHTELTDETNAYGERGQFLTVHGMRPELGPVRLQRKERGVVERLARGVDLS